MSNPVQRPAANCEACTYWQYVAHLPDSDALSFGTCRKNAPAATAHSEHSMSFPLIAVWPVTGSNDWCGDWVG